MAYVNLSRRGFVGAVAGLGAARGRNHVLPAMNLYPRRAWRRGVAGFGARGLGVSFPQVMVAVPQPGGAVTQMPTAETSLANAAAQNINDPSQFTAAFNSPEYSSPAAFSANMIAFAKTLCMNSWAPYTCVGFDPVTMGQKYANIVFDGLRAIILSSTGKSVYDTWVSKPPAVTPDYTPPVIQAPYNPASVPGSSALPPPPVLPPVQSAPVPLPPVLQTVAGSPGVTPNPYSGLPLPGSPQWYALFGGTNPNPPAAGSSSSSSNTAPPLQTAAPNWPLIGGAALLVIGGLYALGGSR